MKSVAYGVLTFTLGVFQSTAFAGNTQPPVVYGQDNRQDLYQVTNPLYRKLADSTVALFETSNLVTGAPGVLSMKTEKMMLAQNVCATEPFGDQPAASYCSGSLIGKNLVLTAGHCITTQDDCATTAFVFGFDITQAGQYPSQTKQSETYFCKSIVHREQNGKGPDFGIIELDRDVVGHEPLRLATHQDPIANGTKVLLVGHPLGLPTKFDDGGAVRDGSPNGFFVATTDAFGGNSGSPVFNQITGEIEGVLVRGEDDFVNNNGCKISKNCSETGCRGEDVTKASSILAFLPTQK